MTTTRKKTTTNKPIPKLQANPFQHEILELASKQRSKAKKIEVLQEYRNPALVSIFIMNFDESVISILPPGPVPYADVDEQTNIGGNLTDMIESKSKSDGMKTTGYYGTEDFADASAKSSIRNEYQNFYLFCKGGSNAISQVRKETIFINMLKGLHPLEAELMCLVKDKKLQDKYKITKEIVAESYPDITWGGRS
jgi:hypothetical protein